MRNLALAMIAFVTCLALGVSGPTGQAEANGSPHRIVLSYQPGVSNWGPNGATGVAELVPAEGEIRLTAIGLPQLSQEAYAVWLVNSKTSQVLALGQFKADGKGEARLDRTLAQPFANLIWDLVLVTVEKEGALPAAPGSRHSIAGFLVEHSQSGGEPQQLPYTGGDSPAVGSASAPAAAQAGAPPSAAASQRPAAGSVDVGQVLPWLLWPAVGAGILGVAWQGWRQRGHGKRAER